MSRLLFVLFLMFATVGYGFTVHTNHEAFKPNDGVSADFEDFDWDWSGFDDQALVADFQDVLFTNVGLRLSHPVRGVVYADYSGTGFVTAVTFTNIVDQTLEY